MSNDPIGRCAHCNKPQFDNPDADPALAAMADLCWFCVKPWKPAAPATMTRAEAARVARELLDAHGLTAWRVSFNRAKRQLGSCNYSTETLTFSAFALAQRSYADSLDTITHEVAHALTKGHGHDRVWQRQHRALGGNGRRCGQGTLTDDTAPWVAECEHGRQFVRYRQPRPGVYRCNCTRRGAPVVFQLNPQSALARSINA